DLELIETRKQFIDDNAVILKQLAEEQARADKQKDKSGADRRVRQTEALVLVTKEANAEIAAANKRLSDNEAQFLALGQKREEKRIELIKARIEIENQDVANQAQHAAKLAEINSEFIRPEEVEQKRYEADKAARDARKQEIIQSLFPQTDPQVRELVIAATTQLNELIGKELDAAAFQRLEVAVKQANLISLKITELNQKKVGKADTTEIDTQVEDLQIQ